MDLDTLLTLIFVCLPILFALICFYYAMYFLKSARTIEDSPTSKIRSAAQGYVELKGTPKPLTSQPTIGKLSQKPCAWYRYTVETSYNIGAANQSKAGWTLIDQGISIDPILLDDGTGQCVIEPFGAEIIPKQYIAWRGHKRVPAPPSTSFFIWLFWESWGPYLYTEYRLEFDMPVHASGMFRTIPATDPRVENSPLLKNYIVENNLPRFNLLLKEGLSPNENFVLSAISEPRLIMQYKIKAFVFFAVFVFFTTVSVHSSYPVIKQSLQAWKKNKLFTRFTIQ